VNVSANAVSSIIASTQFSPRIALSGCCPAEAEASEAGQKETSFLPAGGRQPRTPKSRALCLDKDTQEKMCRFHPSLEETYQLYKTMSRPNLNMACDGVGRNRVLLGAFGAITARNTPGKDDRGA
jgi:hypothetical protein